MAISYDDELNQKFEDLVEGQLDGITEQEVEGAFAAPLLPSPLSMTMPPVVANLTTSVNVMPDDGILDRSDIGVSTFTITIDFDQAMNTTVLPTISFPTIGEDPGALFTFTGFAWSNGNQTYTLTFTVNDLEIEIPDVDIQVSGAQNSSGDVMTTAVIADVFSIDMDGDAGDDLAVSFDDGNGFIDSSEDLSAVDFTVSGLDSDSTAVVTFTGTDAMGMAITQTVNVSVDGSLTADLIGFAAGSVTATIESTDNAGNMATGTGDSSVIDGSADADGDLSLTVSDTAVNAADGNSLSFDVAGLDGDLTSAIVTFSDGMNMVMVDVSGGDGTYNVDLSTLDDGNITSVLGVTDAAGNTASDNGADIDLDRTADAGIGLFISIPDTNIDLSESTMVSFSISDLDADLVSAIVTFSDGVDNVTVDVSGGDGPYSVDLSSLADGTITSSIAVIDDAGNTAGANGPDITMDTDVPDAPVITSISTDSGANTSDGVTNDNEVTIFGTAEANAYVEVFSNGMSIGTVQANGMGDWSIDYPDTVPDGADKDGGPLFLPAGLADGTYSLTAVTTDAVGNSSPASAAFTLEIDTDDPDAPVISSTITNDAGVIDSDGTTTDATPTLSITAEAGSTVEVFIDGASAGFAVETATAGTFTFTSAALTTGSHDFTATSTDLAGNTSPASMTMTLSISEFAEITAITDDENAATMDGLNDGTGTIVDGDAPDIATTSGTISFEDFAAGQSHSVTAILPPPGALGNFSVSLLNSATDDGLGVAGWSFAIANADIDFLDAGDTITQNYIVRITDGDGNETDQAITIIILGTDDAAVITADETGAVAEGDIGDPAVTATGTIAVTDADDDDNPSFANAAATGTYGSLVVNAAGDEWTYTLDQNLVQDMDAGDMEDDVITLTDDEGNSVDITITITGTDDAAIITGDTTGAVTEGDIGDAPVTVTGAIGVSDIDADDNPSFANVGEIGLYGVLTVNPAGDEWTYTLNQAAAQELDAGDMVDDVITLTDDEGNTRDITITITGTADDAIVTADTTGSVNEGDLGDSVTTTGAIAVSDADADDNPSFANATFTGTYGTITVNAAGDQWTYTLDQASVQDLDAGDMVTDNLTLTDDEGNSVDIDIAITGTNDEPIATALMGTVTEDGTPSISASNGAQASIPNAGYFYILDYDTGIMTAVARIGAQSNADVAPTNGMVVQINPNSSSFAVAASTYTAGIETFVDPATFTVTGYMGASAVSGDSLSFDDSASGITIEINAASIGTPDGTSDFNVVISGLDYTDGVDLIDISDLTFDVQPIDSSQVTVTAMASDVDDSAVLTYSVDGTGTIGRVINNGDGTFTYDSDNQFEYLAAGETATDTFTYTADDGLGGTSTETVTITITGSNDAPIISAGMGDTDVFNLSEADGVTAMGTLSVADVDLTDTVSVAVSSVTESGDVSGIANGTLLAMLGVDMGDIIDNMNDEGTVNLDFDSGMEGFDYLAVGNTLTLTYTVTVTDSQHATDSYDVTVNIAGTNDGPVITTPMGGNEGAVTEDAPVSMGGGDLTPIPLGTDIQVNTTTTGDQRYSTVAALNDGGFIVSWSSNGQDGSGWGIYAQRYDAMGTAIGTEFQVNTETANSQEYSTMTALNDGGFVVSWSALNQDGSNWGIYAQRYDAMGAAIGTEVLVNTTTATAQLYSDVTALNDGGFVVSWQSDQDGSGWGIYAQRYDAMGAAIGTEFQVNTTTTNNQQNSDVTALNDGGFIVSWMSFNQDGNGWGVYAQRYDAMGTAMGSEFQVNTTTTGDQFYSDVTALNDGGFIVSWMSNGQDGSGYGVYAQRYDAMGAAIGTEFQVNTATFNSQQYSDVTALNDGGFVISWSSFNQDGDDWGLYGQRYDAMGAAIGAEFLINSITAGNQISDTFTGMTTIDTLADGRLVATWTGAGTEEVFTRIIDVPAPGPSTNSTTGQITADDADAGAVLTFSGDAVGTYGAFVIDAMTGEWSFTLDEADPDTDALTEGQIVTETFTVTVTDDQMATTTQDVTITITGTNDGPVANDVAAGTFPTVDEDEMFTGELGGMGLDAIPVSLFASDVDSVLDASSFSFDGASIDGGASISAALAGITYDSMTGSFTFDGSVEAYQYLGENETVDVVVDFTVTDDNMASDTGTVTFTVRGTNDGPVITTPMGGNEGAVTEDTPMPEASSAMGQITADDADAGAVLTFSGDAVGTYGAFVINAMTGEWTYNLDDLDPDTDALTEGQIVTETFTVTVTDDQMATTTQDVTITITGTNDGPVATDETLADLNEGDSTVVTLGGMTLAIADLATDVDSTLDSESFDFTDVTIDGVSTTLALAGISYDAMTGELTIDADVAAYNGLAIGDSAEIILTFEVTDDFMATDTGTLTFNVDGTNDGPVITTPMGGNEGAVTEDAPVSMGGGDLTPVPTGTDIQVNATSAGTQTGSVITALPGGGFVVIFTDFSAADGAGAGLFGQRYDAMGIAVGGEFQVNTTTSGNQFEPSVTTLADGGFIVIFTDSSGEDGDSLGVFGQRYDAMGVAIGGEFQVNTTNTSFQSEPDVMALADGGFIVTFSDGSGGDGANSGVFGQRYDAMGGTVGTQFQINTTTPSNQNQSSVAALTDGGFVVTFSEASGADGDSTGIFGQRYDAMGVTVGGEFQINTTVMSSQSDSNVTALSDGGFVVTFTDFSGADGDIFGIFGQRFDSMGAAVGTEFQVNTTSTFNQYSASVTALSDGGFVVVFTDTSGADGSDDSILGQRFDAMGIAIGSEFVVSQTTTGDQTSPQVVELADGRLAVSFTSDTTGSNRDVLLRIIDVPDTGPTTNSTTGQITADDADAGAVLIFSGDAVGTYGAFVIDAMTGEWTFTLDEADTDTDALTEGQIVTETFTVTVTDDAMATTTQDVTITITGSNDEATISASMMEDNDVTEAGGDSPVGTPGDPDAGGTLSVSDVDTGEDVFEAPVAGDLVGDYGTFTFDDLTGEWTYVLDNSNTDVQALEDGDTLIDTLTVSSLDGTDSYDIDVTINGADDAATIEPGSDLEAQVDERADGAVDENTGTINTTGTIIFDDAEVSDAHTVTFTPITGPGTVGSIVDYIGTFSSNYTQDSSGANTGMITWDFDVNAADLNYLDEGETLVQLYEYSITGDDGTVLTQVITITIVGVEDLADISGTITGSVTEGNIGDAAVTATGTLTLSDPDLLDAGTPPTFADVAATTGDNGYGTFEMTAGQWTFILDQTAVQGFSSGEVFQDTFTFTASDGATQLIAVDIHGADDVFVGTPNIDTLTGTEGVDTITGLESDDIINALGGDDYIEGGEGADTIDGGMGSDTASYENSGSGVTIDLLAGTASGGHAAGDVLTSIENIVGSAFNDHLTGNMSDNLLEGGDGNDRFWGTDGTNSLIGGNGADQFFGGAGADFMDGGAGFDTVDYRSSLAGITANLTTGGTAGDASGDTYAGIERFYGTDFNDTINGSDGNEFLYGEDGNDTINGGGGIDRIFGGDGDDIQRGEAGNDTLYGSAGADQLNGGIGNDNANYSLATSAVELNMATGGTVGDAAGDTYFGIEVIFGSSFNDVITGNAATNDLRGGGGDDTLNGGDGNDRLHGGVGADVLDGGSGIDSAQYATASAGVIVDLVSGGTGGEAAGDSYSSIEWVFGSNFDDSITGDTGNNNLHGNDGADTLNGGGGNDRLFGGDGDDIINGGDGIDTLYGQNGNDSLSGGLGNDFFFGSDGGDSFDGGDDFDTVSYLASSSGIAVNMQTGSTFGDAAGDSYVSIERLLATNFNDIVIGSDGNDVLQGLGGDDVLGGGQGADSLSGGAGIDQFLYDTNTSGADVILDFLGGSRGDETINLTNFDTDFDSFAEVFAAATQVGNNVIIDFGGGNTLTLANYSLTYLDSTAFEFASVPLAEPFEEAEAGQDVDMFATDVLV